MADAHNITVGMNSEKLEIQGNAAYYDMTSNPLLLSATRNILLDIAGVAGKDAYMYIDLDNDGCFTVMMNEEGLPGVSSELLQDRDPGCGG